MNPKVILPAEAMVSGRQQDAVLIARS